MCMTRLYKKYNVRRTEFKINLLFPHLLRHDLLRRPRPLRDAELRARVRVPSAVRVVAERLGRGGHHRGSGHAAAAAAAAVGREGGGGGARRGADLLLPVG